VKASDPEAAIVEFLGVPALEKEKGEWGFKGLKQAIKLEFKLGQYDKVSLILQQIYIPSNYGRLLSIMANFSPMSNPPSPEIILKSLSIIC